MKLPRRHYLKLANVSGQLFSTLHRRSQVPLGPRGLAPFSGSLTPAQPSPSDIVEEREQDGYTAFDALKLALADQLVSSCSFSRDSSASLADRSYILKCALDLEKAGKQAWLATFDLVGFEGNILKTPENREFYLPHETEVGELDYVLDSIKEYSKQLKTEAKSVTLVNLSALIQEVRNRATEIGLDIDLMDGAPK